MKSTFLYIKERYMPYRGISILLWSILLATIFLGACTEKDIPIPNNELVVGAVLPMTGDSANYGTVMADGARLAFEQYNALNPKIPVKFVVEDSMGQPKTGVNATTKLILQDKAQAILIAFSGVILASAPVATENKVVMINGPANSPKLRGASPFLFNLSILSDQEGEFLANVSFNELHGKRVAIFYTDNDSGSGFMRVFSSKFQELGGTVVAVEPHMQNASDFRLAIEKVKRQQPDIAFIAAYYKEAAFLLRQADEVGFKPKWLSYAAIESPDFLSLAGKSAEGVVYSQAGFDLSIPTPLQQRFVDTYKAKYEKEPGVWAAQFYDAAQIITEALKKFKAAPNGEQLRDAITNAPVIQGVGGEIKFSLQGINNRSILLKMVTGGKFIPWLPKYPVAVRTTYQ